MTLRAGWIAVAVASSLVACSPGPGGNSAPVAKIVTLPAVLIGTNVTLGNGSTDPEGDALACEWTLTPPAGSSAALSSATACTPAFTADAAGAYVLTLVVNDGALDSAPASVTISAYPARSIPDSGQTTFYAAGDDSTHSAHPLTYSDHWDGTVTDSVTGLMWQKCALGRSGTGCSTGASAAFTWYEAAAPDPAFNPTASVDPCGASTLAGYSDWRLPSARELLELADHGRSGPAIDSTCFPATGSASYWSATPARWPSSSPGWAYWDEYVRGTVDDFMADQAGVVRCVRGDPTGAVLVSDGDTVSDLASGLEWQRADSGTARSWADALSYCGALSLAGHADWRLPEVKELVSIVDFTRWSPALDRTLFGVTVGNGLYWSSTTAAGVSSDAWALSTNHGTTGQVRKTNAAYVRCVR